jgi:hypothetical protein
LVQAHPEAQESQEKSWDFLLHKAFIYKAFRDTKGIPIIQVLLFLKTPDSLKSAHF